MARPHASSVPSDTLNWNFPFVYIERETQRIVSYETMQCLTELNDTLASVQNDTLTTAAVSTFFNLLCCSVLPYSTGPVSSVKPKIQFNNSIKWTHTRKRQMYLRNLPHTVKRTKIFFLNFSMNFGPCEIWAIILCVRSEMKYIFTSFACNKTLSSTNSNILWKCLVRNCGKQSWIF